MAATIPGVASLEPFDTAFTDPSSPTAGSYYAVPPIGEPGRESAADYEELMNTWPGVDNVGIKRLGFRGRKLMFDVVIVGASKSACETTKNTILDAASALARYTAKVDGGTSRPGCKLVKGSGNITRWFTIGTKICCILELHLIQLSDSN